MNQEQITNVPPLSDKAAQDLYAHPDEDAEGIKRFMAPQPDGTAE